MFSGPLTTEDKPVVARKNTILFLGGCCALPWLWAAALIMFGSDLRHIQDGSLDPVYRKYLLLCCIGVAITVLVIALYLPLVLVYGPSSFFVPHVMLM